MQRQDLNLHAQVMSLAAHHWQTLHLDGLDLNQHTSSYEPLTQTYIETDQKSYLVIPKI